MKTPETAAVARQPHRPMDMAISGTTSPLAARPRLSTERARARCDSNQCTTVTESVK